MSEPPFQWQICVPGYSNIYLFKEQILIISLFMRVRRPRVTRMASSDLHLRGYWLEYGQRADLPAGFLERLLAVVPSFLAKTFISHGREVAFPQLLKGLLQRLLCYDTISEDTHCHLLPIIYWEQVSEYIPHQ